jgi:hypothetical protein
MVMPRPSAAELMAMDAADFEAFVRESGIKTVSDTETAGEAG